VICRVGLARVVLQRYATRLNCSRSLVFDSNISHNFLALPFLALWCRRVVRKDGLVMSTIIAMKMSKEIQQP